MSLSESVHDPNDLKIRVQKKVLKQIIKKEKEKKMTEYSQTDLSQSLSSLPESYGHKEIECLPGISNGSAASQTSA